MSILSKTVSSLLNWGKQKRGKGDIRSFSRKLRFEQCEDRRLLAITVDALHDITDLNDGDTTLREAIEQANVAPGADQIDFAANLFTQSGDPTKATIQLTQSANTRSGLIITDDVTLEAPAGFELEISAAGLGD